MQEVVDKWEAGIRATDSALIASRSYWYLLNFQWCNIKWHLIQGMPGDIHIRDTRQLLQATGEHFILKLDFLEQSFYTISKSLTDSWLKMNLHFLLQFNLALHNTLPRLNKLGHLDICLMGHFLPFFEDHQAIILHNSPNTTFLYATTLVDISMVVSVFFTSKRHLAWHWRRSSHPLSMANKALLSCCYRMDPLEESANNVGAFRHQPSAESPQEFGFYHLHLGENGFTPLWKTGFMPKQK